ncbi:MAG: DUF456 domain-containing protein [Anaerolineae bacterium]|nr:MAG: DUF456 domain-containing protein [Anaerolineae bacterium]
MSDLWLTVALALMFIGLLGVLLPVVPGVALIWLVALVYAIAEGFKNVDPITMIVLSVIAIPGITADIWVSSLGAKAGGASLWSILTSLLGAVVGFFVFSLPGALIGALVGLVAVELLRAKDWRQALKASGGWVAGWLLSTVVQMVVGIVMIAIFWWQARGG